MVKCQLIAIEFRMKVKALPWPMKPLPTSPSCWNPLLPPSSYLPRPLLTQFPFKGIFFPLLWLSRCLSGLIIIL